MRTVTTTVFRGEIRDDLTAAGARRVIVLSGEFDGEAAARLERTLAGMAPLDGMVVDGMAVDGMVVDEMVVDLSAVTFIDSTGLRLLVDWRRDADDRGSTMKLLSATAPVRRLLDATRLSEFFTEPDER